MFPTSAGVNRVLYQEGGEVEEVGGEVFVGKECLMEELMVTGGIHFTI